MSEQEQCSEEVWKGFHSHTCPRTGVVQREGRWFCRQHDPKVREGRLAEKMKKSQREIAANAARELAVEIADALAAYPVHKVPEGLRPKVLQYNTARKRACPT